MAGFDGKFTMIAGQAMNFAGLFNEAFRAGLQGPVPFRIELTSPAGPSTAGGKQALQHIRLVPAQGPAIVIGSCNPGERASELRTFRHLADIHAQRFKGAPMPLDAANYAGLLKALQQFFTMQGFAVVMLEVSASLAPPPNPGSSAAATWALAIVLLAILVAGAAFFFLRAR